MSESSTPQVGLSGAAKLAFQLFLTGIVTWFILRAIDFDLNELRNFDLSTLTPNWGLILLSSLILLVAYLYSAGLWGLMVRGIGGPEVGLVPSLRVFFTANLGRYVPGKLWQIAGLAYLARGEGVSAGTAATAAVLGQAFSLAGATLVGSGVLLNIGRGPDLGGEWVVAVVLALLLAASAPGVFKTLLPLWFRLAKRDAPGGFRPDHGFGLRWMGLYAIGWVLQGIAFWVLVRGFGWEITLLEGVPAYSAAYVAGYVVLFAPAGVGVREGILVLFLGPILGTGAAVAALMARLWTTLIELIPAVFLAGGYLKPSSKKGEKEVG